MENLQKQQQNQLSNKYENSLRQIKIMFDQNEELKQDNIALNNEINSLKDSIKTNEQQRIKEI